MAPIYPTASLGPDPSLPGQPFDRLVVMTSHEPAKVRRQFKELGVPSERVFWL